MAEARPAGPASHGLRPPSPDSVWCTDGAAPGRALRPPDSRPMSPANPRPAPQQPFLDPPSSMTGSTARRGPEARNRVASTTTSGATAANGSCSFTVPTCGLRTTTPSRCRGRRSSRARWAAAARPLGCAGAWHPGKLPGRVQASGQARPRSGPPPLAEWGPANHQPGSAARRLRRKLPGPPRSGGWGTFVILPPGISP
jgi:hypothetical protein